MRRSTRSLLLWLLSALIPWPAFAATTMDFGNPHAELHATVFDDSPREEASTDECDHQAPHPAAAKGGATTKCGACACCVAVMLPGHVPLIDARRVAPLVATPLRVTGAEFLTAGVERPPRLPARPLV